MHARVRRLSTKHGKESDAKLQARRCSTQMGFIPRACPIPVAGRVACIESSYIYLAARQCRADVPMYMSQLAYKTVAFALILEGSGESGSQLY